eukprot:TRINITY_DN3207_c0_g1_i2.p1 TRINITY_DN3207_c0_g1~~TRINITY_DN3207_c0_g1_i2.p1  ORF type:complete len:154 (+),score=43.21 TRINITY_DN3207_c0_g1_i2:195-656(+)
MCIRDSCMTKHGLLPLSQEALIYYKRLSYHKFEGSATELSERGRLADAMGTSNKVCLLENHGPVCGGSNLAEALRYMMTITRACEYQCKALASVGGNLDMIHMPDPATLDEMAARIKLGAEAKNESGYDEQELLWQANVRMVEKRYGKDQIYK